MPSPSLSEIPYTVTSGIFSGVTVKLGMPVTTEIAHCDFFATSMIFSAYFLLDSSARSLKQLRHPVSYMALFNTYSKTKPCIIQVQIDLLPTIHNER